MRPHLAEHRMAAMQGIAGTDAGEIERGLEELRFQRRAVRRVVMGRALVIEEAEGLEGHTVVDKAGGNDIAVAAEIPLKESLLHNDIEGIPRLHLVHEVHLMAEHVSKLKGKGRTFS